MNVRDDFAHLGMGELLAVRDYWRSRNLGEGRFDREARARLAAIEAEIAHRRAGWPGEPANAPSTEALPSSPTSRSA